MRTGKLLLVPILLVVLANEAPAGIIFGRKPQQPTNPAEHVRELLVTVQTSQDERKVVSAIEELRTYDASTYPQIVAVLSDSLRRDPRFGVRLEAAQTLGRVRPMSQQAGQALEEALNDSAMRVRWQARTSLMWYYTAGFNARKQDLSTTPANGKDNPRPENTSPQPTVNTQPRQPAPATLPAQGLPTQTTTPQSPYGTVARPLPRGPNEPIPVPQVQPQQVIVNRPSTNEPPLARYGIPVPVVPSVPVPPEGPVFPEVPVNQPVPVPETGPTLPLPPQNGNLPLGPTLPPQVEVPAIPLPAPAQSAPPTQGPSVPPGTVSQGPALPPQTGEPPLPGVPVGQPSSRPVPPPASAQSTGPVVDPLPEF